MPLSSLNHLFVHQLRDCYAAENQLFNALPRFLEEIKNEEVRSAFHDHREATKKHLGRLHRILERLGAEVGRMTCYGMEGLVKEGDRMIAERAEDTIQDAGLVAIAQRIAHYKISAYCSLRTIAERLGYDDFAWSLTETLEDAREADQRLTTIADAVIHQEAAEASEVG